MNFQQLPKIELHLHLDCSLSYDVVRKIDASISPADFREKFIAPAKCRDLADYLTRAPQGFALMQTERQLQLVTRDLFDQLQRDSVIYAEIRFAPLQHLQKGLTPENVVEIVEQATAAAIRETGIEARLILCTLRHFSEAQSLQTVKLVERFRGTTVAGFDIAADEAGYPIDAHIAAFRYACDRKIPRTAHAGEARGPESVWETLKNFCPSRIGHGVRSIEDPRLIEHLKTAGIHLEVCPSCNVQIDIVDQYADHPIDKLYRAGVSVGVNTDTRTITNITLTQEYQKLHQTFGWTAAHFLHCNLNAIRAAFIPEKLKQALSRKVRGAYRG